MTATGVRRAMIAALRPPRMGLVAWSALPAAMIGANLLDYAAVPAPGTPPGVPFIVASIMRLAIIGFAGFAVLRLLAGHPRPLKPGVASVRYVALSLILFIGLVLVTFTLVPILSAGQPLERQWLAMLLVSILWSALTLRLLALQAGLANGAPFRAIGPLWRGQKGRWGALFLGYVALVLPFAAIHLALSLVGGRLPLTAGAAAALAVVDGAVQAVQLAFTSALAVVAWRLAGGVVEAERRPG